MSRNMKEYTQKKNHTAVHNVTKGLIKKTDIPQHERIHTPTVQFSNLADFYVYLTLISLAR